MNPGRPGKRYENKRPGYYQRKPRANNRGPTGETQQEDISSDSNRPNTFDYPDGPSSTNYDVNFNRSFNALSCHSPSRGRSKNLSKPHRNQDRDFSRSFAQSETQINLSSEGADLSRRGKVVSGRYIRQQLTSQGLSRQSKQKAFSESTAYSEQYSKNHLQQSASVSVSKLNQQKAFPESTAYTEQYSKHHYQQSSNAAVGKLNQQKSFPERTAYSDQYSKKHYGNSASEPKIWHPQGCESNEVEPTVGGNSSHTKVYSYASKNRNSRQLQFSRDQFSNASYDSSKKSYTNTSRFYHKENGNKRSSTEKSSCSSIEMHDKASQRELLTYHLEKGDCECLVCCEFIRTKDATWHCLSCYHVFHLRCIKKWAKSPASVVEGGSWRCPACQTLTGKVPYDYFCFCGRNRNPDFSYHLTPHSCGETCNRLRPECSHPCKELCHPGPCPPCAVVVTKTCPCGKMQKALPCYREMGEDCEEVCDKLLNCGVHHCQNICHKSVCPPCEETILQRCHCQKHEKSVTCSPETSGCCVYSCGEVCSKQLGCSHHSCPLVCHPGPCSPCRLSPGVVDSCACGKFSLQELISSGRAKERLSCLDPVPTCGQVCGKRLRCGTKGSEHSCKSLCHEGDCPECLLATSLKCACGAFTKEFPCTEISDSFVYTCERRCNRRKDCGRHKCLNKCCTSAEHRCDLVCNRKLSCGLHQCQETCHGGNCPTCWNVSFDELRCHCGESVLYPPIHCGTKPPDCPKPCTREHPCEHPVKHCCHSDEKCPPCTHLTTKWCYGNHKQCNPVMCFLEGVSCGMPCLKPLSCGRHECRLTCHPGPCMKEGEKCLQPCTSPREACGHPCGVQCHNGPCPETPCKAQVTLSCPCGHRSETSTCHDSTKCYRLLSSTILATKLQEIKEGQSVNLNEVLGKKSKNNKLQCNEECAVIERNKRLAVALQIQNPDLSCSPGPPSYSEFLKEEAKKNPTLVSDIYSKISDLVQLAKQSKQKCRSYSFPPMNRDHRRVVHELAEFFGCETQSYDEEPKKNVVVTAYKNKSWLPFISIMTVVQRDMGIRKGPAPVPLSQPQPKSSAVEAAMSQKKKIDYFDYKE